MEHESAKGGVKETQRFREHVRRISEEREETEGARECEGRSEGDTEVQGTCAKDFRREGRDLGGDENLGGPRASSRAK
jgi:hypothetical protein